MLTLTDPRIIKSQIIECNTVPSNVLESAMNTVLSKTGTEFFNTFYIGDTCFLNINYTISFRFKISPHSIEPHFSQVIVDTSGKVVKTNYIPDCINHPSECDFPFSKSDIEAKARELNFSIGIKEWDLDFHWYNGKVNSFVWVVTNYHNEFSGVDLVFDANSGELIEEVFWDIIE